MKTPQPIPSQHQSVQQRAQQREQDVKEAGNAGKIIGGGVGGGVGVAVGTPYGAAVGGAWGLLGIVGGPLVIVTVGAGLLIGGTVGAVGGAVTGAVVGSEVGKGLCEGLAGFIASADAIINDISQSNLVPLRADILFGEVCFLCLASEHRHRWIKSGHQHERCQHILNDLVKTLPQIAGFVENVYSQSDRTVKPDFQSVWIQNSWEIAVVDTDEKNAFCLPGGKICIYSGLFKLINDDTELAFVIAHEMMHAILRHGTQTMCQNVAMTAIIAFLRDLTKDCKGHNDPLTAHATMWAYLGLNSAFSQSRELDADEGATKLLQAAGLNAQAGPRVFQSFASLEESSFVPKFFSTHPPLDERKRRVQCQIRAVEEVEQCLEEPMKMNVEGMQTSAEIQPFSGSCKVLQHQRRPC